MRRVSGSIGSRFGLAAALLAVGYFMFAAAPDAQAKGKNKEHKVHGTITKVETESGKDGVTWITVEVHHHHKKGAPEANPQVSEVRRFKLTNETTYVEKVSKSETKPATIQEVAVGKHVALQVHDDKVEILSVHDHHGKKNKA